MMLGPHLVSKAELPSQQRSHNGFFSVVAGISPREGLRAPPSTLLCSQTRNRAAKSEAIEV